MTEEDDIRRFREENAEMIEKVLAQERADRRADFEDRMAEADRLRAEAREEYRRAMDAARLGFDDESAHFYEAMKEERERLRAVMNEERAYRRMAALEARERLRSDRDYYRAIFDEDVSEVIRPFADPDFHKHLVGIGMEAYAAFMALVRAGPFPNAVKDAVDDFDLTKSATCARKAADMKRERREHGPERIEIGDRKKGGSQ